MTDPAVDSGPDHPRSPILERPGAIDADDGSPDRGVPLHHGDPLGEQRAAETGAIVVDRSHRDVLSISGAERLTWLEGFVSQHVADLPAHSGGETLVLDAQGRVEHHALLATSDDTVYLDTEAGRGQALLGFLQKMVFWADAAPVRADLAVVTLAGAAVPAELTAPDGSVVALPPASPQVTTVDLPGGGVARRLPWPGDGSVDLLVPRESLAAWFDAAVAAGARPAGTWALDALRVADPGPLHARVGVDTDERTIPHEIPAWIGAVETGGAVHLDKGCYRGQETVARVHNLGRSPRVLVRLQLDGSGDSLPEPGSELRSGGRPVGRVGTVLHHHEEGPVALALLKRAVPPDTELDAGGVAASIDPRTVPDQAGPQAGREAVRRLRGG